MAVISSKTKLFIFLALFLSLPLYPVGLLGNATIDSLILELQKPLSPDVPEAYRDQIRKLAEAIASEIRENPRLLNLKRKRQIFGILASKDPGLAAAQNDLNQLLPSDFISQLDDQVTQSRLDSSNNDPCSVMCRIAKALSERVTDSFMMKEDKFVHSTEAKSSFHFAVGSLVAEFLLKANRRGCEIQSVDKKISHLMKEANTFAQRKSGFPGNETEQKSVQKAVGQVGGSEEATKSALEFLEKVSHSPDNTEMVLPSNSATLYFYLQMLRLVETLKLTRSADQSENTIELEKNLLEGLKRITSARKDLIEGDGASLLTTYTLAALGASAPRGSKTQKEIAQILGDLREEMRKEKSEGFPYNFSSERALPTERGAAARSVVAQLAIYKGGEESHKLKNADELFKSILIYQKNFRDIFSGIGLNRTHDYSNEDLLAPYYGPSTIPYVFEAVSLLEKEPNLRQDQKNQLKELRKDLQKKLLGMFEPNGLFQSQYKGYYAGSFFYDNALTGLALENACQGKMDEKKPIYEELQRRKRRSSPSDPSLPPRKQHRL